MGSLGPSRRRGTLPEESLAGDILRREYGYGRIAHSAVQCEPPTVPLADFDCAGSAPHRVGGRGRRRHPHPPPAEGIRLDGPPPRFDGGAHHPPTNHPLPPIHPRRTPP